MEQGPSGRRVIFYVLDLLLIMGAIASILTIDRGKWLIENPAFYSATDGVENSAIIYGAYAGEVPVPLTGALCQKAAQVGNQPEKTENRVGTAGSTRAANQSMAVAMVGCGQ